MKQEVLTMQNAKQVLNIEKAPSFKTVPLYQFSKYSKTDTSEREKEDSLYRKGLIGGAKRFVYLSTLVTLSTANEI